MSIEFCIGEVCYHYEPNAKDFGDAQKDCLKSNRKLFEPQNKATFDQVVNFAKTKRAGNGDIGWIGVYTKNDANWLYHKESGAIKYNKWSQGIPTNPDKDCVALNPDGKWIDLDCVNEKRSYICQDQGILQ